MENVKFNEFLRAINQEPHDMEWQRKKAVYQKDTGRVIFSRERIGNKEIITASNEQVFNQYERGK